MDFAYTASFDGTGKLGALDLKIPADMGSVAGFNPLLTSMAVGEADNVFHWPGGLKATMELNVTNKPTNTPMRAPGTMQVESILSIAQWAILSNCAVLSVVSALTCFVSNQLLQSVSC